MKSTKRQRRRQRRLNCKMLSSCWFLFFFLFFHLFCFCFGRWQRCVFSPTRMQLLAAAPSPRRLSSPYFSLHLALLQRIVDRATRTSSNQICFMTTATTQNDAQTHTHTHTNVLCVCLIPSLRNFLFVVFVAVPISCSCRAVGRDAATVACLPCTRGHATQYDCCCFWECSPLSPSSNNLQQLTFKLSMTMAVWQSELILVQWVSDWVSRESTTSLCIMTKQISTDHN